MKATCQAINYLRSTMYVVRKWKEGVRAKCNTLQLGQPLCLLRLCHMSHISTRYTLQPL